MLKILCNCCCCFLQQESGTLSALGNLWNGWKENENNSALQTDMMRIWAVWVKPWVKDTAQLWAETALRLPAAVRSLAVGIKVFQNAIGKGLGRADKEIGNGEKKNSSGSSIKLRLRAEKLDNWVKGLGGAFEISGLDTVDTYTSCLMSYSPLALITQWKLWGLTIGTRDLTATCIWTS